MESDSLERKAQTLAILSAILIAGDQRGYRYGLGHQSSANEFVEATKGAVGDAAALLKAAEQEVDDQCKAEDEKWS